VEYFAPLQSRVRAREIIWYGRYSPKIASHFHATVVRFTGTSRPLVNGIRASVISKRDTEKCIVGGRDRHTTDARLFEDSIKIGVYGDLLSFANLPHLGDALCANVSETLNTDYITVARQR
jgi:hypothetical protein